MGTFNARWHDDDPLVYENVTGAVILGGKVAIPVNGATLDPSVQGFAAAGDAALNVLGITEHDTVPRSLRAGLETGTTTSWDAANAIFDSSVPDATTTVYNDVVGKLKTTTACANGDKICAAANGDVRKALTADITAGAVIGSCVNPQGVAANGVGLFRVRVQ
jgi:hypothetical protein